MAVAVASPRVMNRFIAPKVRPLVVGHRGVPMHAPENTLAGFRRAVALGLDAIELDVRRTRDGRAVVFHDASLERLTGDRRAISDLTWDQLSKLRVHRTHPIPLLAEVLAEVGRSIAINIELKPRWRLDDLGTTVAREIAEAGAIENVLVTSYDPRRLWQVRRHCPELVTGFSWSEMAFGFGRYIAEQVLAPHRRLRVSAVAADHALLDAGTSRWLRSTGAAVGAHVLFPLDGAPTEDSEVERLVALGVDWLESDDPERLQKLISAR